MRVLTALLATSLVLVVGAIGVFILNRLPSELYPFILSIEITVLFLVFYFILDKRRYD